MANDVALKQDFWVCAIDVTAHYEIDEKDKPFIKAIKDVFFYDRNTRTFCCEVTPSYYLIHLYTFIEFADDAPEECRDEIDERYCYEPTDNCYMHCSTVESLPEQKQYDATGKEEQSEEIVREFWQGNYPF